MSWTVPKTWVSGAVLSKTDLDTHIRDNLNFLKTNIALEEAVELTISDGEITIAYSHHSIDTEGNAASDDLVTINGGEEGRVVLIRPASGERTVILKHGTGNIYSPSGLDITLDDESDYCLLVYDGENWCAIATGTAAASAFTELTDAPASYSGQGGKVVAVKGDQSGLEFITALSSLTLDAGTVTDENNTVIAIDLGEA